MTERDFFLRWIAEARRSMTREAHEDGRTEGEIVDDLGNVLANFGADSFAEDPEQVAEHDRLLALPRTYSLPPCAPAASRCAGCGHPSDEHDPAAGCKWGCAWGACAGDGAAERGSAPAASPTVAELLAVIEEKDARIAELFRDMETDREWSEAESAPAASGWRREPPTVEEVKRWEWWWVADADLSEDKGEPSRWRLDEGFTGALQVQDGIGDWDWPEDVFSDLKGCRFAPCLPPSAPAADAGIVARVESTNGPLALVFMPEPHGAFTVDLPGAKSGDRVEVLVRMLADNKETP